MIENLALGLGTALHLQNVLFCFIGVLLGTLIGILPGVGPTATIAMLLPVTITLQPETAMIMLAGIFYGAQYGGSTTAILLNLPGEASAAVTAIDGYKMAQKGRAGPALAIAAIGSFFAGTVATFLIALFAPMLTEVALAFGSPDYFALMVLGLICAVALAHGSMILALGMVVLGLIAGLAGTDIYTAAPRYTFSTLELADGFNFVAVAVGLFGVSEILRNLEDEDRRDVSLQQVGSLMPSREDIRRCIAPVIRATGLGSLLGTLPGGGATLSAFAAYTMEKRLSKNAAEFGEGAVEAVAAPESANNAAAQTSFIPMLTLGIPSNAVMALMIGALVIQGVIPGPNVISDQPTLFWGIICSMWIGNVILVILNLPLVGVWVKLLSLPYKVLFPAIMAFASIGVYSISNSFFDLYIMAIFGFLGYVLIKLKCEPAPFLLGFILGPMLEEYLRRSMILSRGDPMIFVQRPISATLLGAAFVILLFVFVPAISARRDKVFVEGED